MSGIEMITFCMSEVLLVGVFCRELLKSKLHGWLGSVNGDF